MSETTQAGRLRHRGSACLRKVRFEGGASDNDLSDGKPVLSARGIRFGSLGRTGDPEAAEVQSGSANAAQRMENTRPAVDTLDLLRRAKHGEGSGTSEEGSGKETVSKEDIRLLKSAACKEPAAKIAKALKRTEGSKGKERAHLAQHDQKKRVPATKR